MPSDNQTLHVNKECVTLKIKSVTLNAIQYYEIIIKSLLTPPGKLGTEARRILLFNSVLILALYR